MLSITDLTSRYPVLCTLSSYLSSLDLLNLALSSKTTHAHTLSSPRLFTSLLRNCICDGHGVSDRQNQTGLYALSGWYWWGRNERRIWADEPIEVALYNTKCDPADTLPCRKCGINVCEECRYFPREWPDRPERRPHLAACWSSRNVMCLCEKCDVKMDVELEGKFLNELCDCDVFTRWICGKCKREEYKSTREYYDKHTVREPGCDDDCEDDTKVMMDHQFNRGFYCLCGKSVPDKGRARCTWCKRKHLHEDDWHREWEEVGKRMPFFENDKCYPRFTGDNTQPFPGYPKLAYDGPIWNAEEVVRDNEDPC